MKQHLSRRLLAYLTVREGDDDASRYWEIGTVGHGPRAASLAHNAADAVREWDRDYGNQAPAPGPAHRPGPPVHHRPARQPPGHRLAKVRRHARSAQRSPPASRSSAPTGGRAATTGLPGPGFLRDGGLLAGEFGIELAGERVQALIGPPDPSVAQCPPGHGFPAAASLRAIKDAWTPPWSGELETARLAAAGGAAEPGGSGASLVLRASTRTAGAPPASAGRSVSRRAQPRLPRPVTGPGCDQRARAAV